MNLRRERTHFSGSTNLVYSNKTMTPQDSKSKTQGIFFSSLSKGKKVSDVLEKRISRNILSPITKVEQLYASSGKLVRSRTQVGYPRLEQLEEHEKRKIAFTGESFLIYDRFLEKYRDQDVSIEKSDPVTKKENLIKEKQNLHGNAVQETQLVGFDNVDTLKDNVDLEKVREARRVLRRRYASRKNLFSIYNAWDEDHTGAVSIENVYTMSKKMGLNLNVDEARVLLASANKSGTGELTLDEFLDLIYNKDDVLNVDLDHLAKNLGTDYLIRREELENGNSNLLEKLEEDAKHARENKHMNQTNLILKNHLHKIAMNFLDADPNKVGYINFEKFEESLKKLAINENIISSQDIKTLFDKHKTDSHTINYKDFVGMLKNFHFQFDELYKEQDNKNTKSTGKPSLVEKDDNEFHIVDCRDLPIHTTVTYLEKTRKVNRAIKRLFPTKEEFYTYLGGVLHIDEGKVNEKYVNRKELKGLVDGLFSHFEKVDVEKRDFEGFLSSVLYNKQGDTNLQEVAKLIYEEKDNEFFDKINFKKKGPGPRRDFSTDTKEEEANGNMMKESIFTTRPQFADNMIDNMSTVKSIQNERDENLDRLLQKIDNQFFVGSKRAYDVFKAFDTDKDGYISRKDLAKKLEDMAVMSKEEAKIVLRYVDPDNKGYVNFQEFSKKIRPNMVQQDEKGDPLVLPFVNPSKENFLKTARTVPNTKEKVKDLISTWRPDFTADPPKTRYGASPSWTNTFLNFQTDNRSPQFMTERERFERDPQTRIKFQIESRDKNRQYDEARLKNKQKFTAFINERVQNETNAFDRLEENRRAKKNFEQTRYEQRAKLFNTYI